MTLSNYLEPDSVLPEPPGHTSESATTRDKGGFLQAGHEQTGSFEFSNRVETLSQIQT